MDLKTKSWMPHAIAIGIFFVLSAAFFPQAFQGYELRQGDIISWVGMSHAANVHRDVTGEEPLWTWSMFSGMPVYQISYNTVGNLFGAVFFLRKMLGTPVYFFFMMMSCFYILMHALKVKPPLAILGSIAFAFSTFYLISMEAGHNTKVHAIAFMPAILAGVIYLFRNKYLLGGLVFAIAFSLQLKANHFQITYYTGLLVGAVLLWKYVIELKQKNIDFVWKSGVVLVVAVILALATNTSSLWSTYEYATSTIRGKSELSKEADGSSNEVAAKGGLDKSYITNWSLGIGETWSLVFPNAKGGPTGRIGEDQSALKNVDNRMKQMVSQSNSYWGNQPFTAGPVYVGAIIVLLFLLGIVTIDNWIKWPLLAITVLAIMLAWGKNFMGLTNIFIDYFPMYNKFRTVTMWLTVVEMIMPIVAVLFLNELITKENFWEKNKKKLMITSGVFLGILVLFGLTPDSFFSFFGDQEYAQLTQQMNQNPQQAGQYQIFIDSIETARMSIFKSDLWRSVGLLVLALAGVFGYGYGKIKGDYLVYGLIVVVTLDLWSVDKRYLNGDKVRGQYVNWMPKEEKKTPFTAENYDLQILQMETKANPHLQKAMDANLKSALQKEKSDRIQQQELMFNTLDTMTNYRVLDLANNTFNTSRTSYFHKTIGGYHAAKLMRYQELIEFHLNRGTGQFHQPVLNMLNTKYVIMGGEQAQVQVNPEAAGNAWFVSNIQWVKNADEEINAIGDFKPKSTAIIDERFKTNVKEEFTSGRIQQVRGRVNHMTYKSSSTSDGFAVFSEVYYQPGWQAFIDGEPAEHVRVDYVLRGMNIPAGDHTIEFKFIPDSYFVGEKISMASSILLLIAAGALLFMQYKKKDEEVA